jgi:hypothetical protein
MFTVEPTQTTELEVEISAVGPEEITIGETAAVNGENDGLFAVIVAP